MLDWIKRAWRGFMGGRLSPRKPVVTQAHYVPQPRSESEQLFTEIGRKLLLIEAANLTRAANMIDMAGHRNVAKDIEARSAREAMCAQKNLRLASISRERSRLKDEVERLKRNKKRHSHLLGELGRLTRLELELEGGK